MSTDYDAVVVGGGMVGSMLAALLAKHCDLSIAVLEQRDPEPFEPGSSPPYDIRVSALSIATQNMFENADAWQGVLDRRACLYRQMLVWDGEESGQTLFDARDIGAPALGHIVENRVVQLALQDQLKNAPNVDYLCPMHVHDYQASDDSVSLVIGSDVGSAANEQSAKSTITTRLLVGADGANSTIRDLAGIHMQRDAYEHHALVATVTTQLEEQDITWQRFLPTGPQAFLPLCGSQASMVWYHNADEIKRLKNLDNDAFIAELLASFPERLGGVDAVSGRGSFPIVKAHAQRYIANRVALVGDAAHTVHPLAGQGVNLGMLDAAALAELIVNARKAGSDVGTRRLLRRYERWRRGENAMMISVLDGFYHAFKEQSAPFRKVRSAAMSVADVSGPIKHGVMRYAMGTGGEVPLFAREYFG